jgi:hypothetical protein
MNNAIFSFFNQKNVKFYKKATILILVFISVLILRNFLLSFFMAFSLFIIASLSMYWKKFTRLSLGIELNSFLTILLSFAFGPTVGMLFGVFSIIIGYFLVNRLCFVMLIPMFGCISISLLSGKFLFFGMPLAGIVLSLIYNLIIHSIYVFLMRFRLSSSIMSFSINLLLNAILFSSVSGVFLRILTGT